MSDVGTNGDSLHCHVRPFVERAREWQKANPEWQLICDMADTETLYQQWSELPKRERMSWIGKYGESARSAFEEFGTKRCKVDAAVLNADMQLCEAWPMGEAMRVYRTNTAISAPRADDESELCGGCDEKDERPETRAERTTWTT